MTYLKNWCFQMFLFVCTIFFSSCADGDSDVFDNEVEVEGLTLQTNFFSDSIPADYFSVDLMLRSENSFAHRFGINPQLADPLVAIQVEAYEDISDIAVQDDDISEFFLVDDFSGGIYQTIPDFLESNGQSQLRVALVFTNRESLTPGAPKLIMEATDVFVRINARFSSGLMYSDSLETQLIP